jgi:hypothetical protein
VAKKDLTVDVSKALTYPFDDKDWLMKISIASLLILVSFIPVFPVVLLLGYLAEIIRRIVLEQQSPSLPEWEDLSTYFKSGFRLFTAGAVYLIPATVLIVIGYAGMILPVVLIDSGFLGEGEAVGIMIAGYLVGFGLMGIGAMISMVTGVILPVAGTHVIVQGDFSAAFRFGEIWRIFKSNWAGFLIAFLVLIGGIVVLYYGSYFLVATVILCCLYPFATCFISAYLGFVGAALFGEAYRVGLANLPSVE